jgi:hypothetical protein
VEGPGRDQIPVVTTHLRQLRRVHDLVLHGGLNRLVDVYCAFLLLFPGAHPGSEPAPQGFADCAHPGLPGAALKSSRGSGRYPYSVSGWAGGSAGPAEGGRIDADVRATHFACEEAEGGGSLHSARGGNSGVVARGCRRIQLLDALVSQRGCRPRLYRIRVGGGYGCEVCRCEPKLRNQQPTATLVARLTWSWCHLWRELEVNMNKACFPWLSSRGQHVSSVQVLVEGCPAVRRR